jgi:hypothetical protein
MRLGILTGPAYDDGYADGKRSRETEIQEAQTRIKKLEEILKNALRCGWHSMEGSIDGTFDDLTEQEIRQFRKDAKSALSEEAEG